MTDFKIRYLLVLLFPVAASLIAIYLAKIQYLPASIGMYELGLSASIICGLLALLYKYGSRKSLYYTLFLLPIVLAFVFYARLGRHISIFATLLPCIGFVLINYIVIRYITYMPHLIRIRTILMGLAGALILSSVYAVLIQLMGQDIPPNFWTESMTNGLVLYVVIAFGISMADLILVRKDVKELQAIQDDEDDA